VTARTRVFRDGTGDRVLGIINPIQNQPSCHIAPCHAHPQDRSVLGVLDVTVSLAEADRLIAQSRARMAGLAALTILASSALLGWLNHALVVRPVRALAAGTRAVAQGDLTAEIQATGNHELADLARGFNSMTRGLADAQRQIVQAEKLAAVGRLAAGLAHEINNPLTGVLTFGSLLLQRVDSQPELREDLEIIVRETKRCREIVKGLLDFSRQIPPERRPIDVNEAVRRAVAVVMNQLRLDHVALRLDLAAGLPPLFADANQIQQVVVNLLLNAADASAGSGGTLRVATRRVDLPRSVEGAEAGRPRPWLEIEVQDSGCGIPPDVLPRVFDPFFSTKGPRGTGLGLAVSWGIIESHGGRIDVESAVGRGSRFIVRLPLDESGNPKLEGATLGRTDVAEEARS
jgi:two-component system NtrC family sensor kinase